MTVSSVGERRGGRRQPSDGRPPVRSVSPSRSLASSGSRDSSPWILSSSASCCARDSSDAVCQNVGALLKAVHLDEVVGAERQAALRSYAPPVLKRWVSLRMSATRSMAIRNSKKNWTYFFTAGLACSTRSRAPPGRARSRGSALIVVATGLRDLAALGGPPDRDLLAVRCDRRLDLRAGALQFRRCGGGPAGVALVVRAAAEPVRLRAVREPGLAVRRESGCS